MVKRVVVDTAGVVAYHSVSFVVMGIVMSHTAISLSHLTVILSDARRQGALRIWLTDQDAVLLWSLNGVAGVALRDLPPRFAGLPVVVGIGPSRVVFPDGRSVAWSLLWDAARI